MATLPPRPPRRKVQDPRLGTRCATAEERRLAFRMRNVFDAAAAPRGAAAAGLRATFADLASHPADAQCALLDVVQNALSADRELGYQVVQATVPYALQIVRALAAAPEAAAECLLAARRISATKRFTVVYRSAIECFGQSSAILSRAELAALAATTAGLPVGSMPTDTYWALTNAHIDGVPRTEPWADQFVVDDGGQVRFRKTGVLIVPCCVWMHNLSGMRPRCCSCHRAIYADVVHCRCLCATVCRECSAHGAHGDCDIMIRRADRLLHRLAGTAGSSFVCFAPSSALLLPIPLELALSAPRMPVLWPEQLRVEDIELLVGYPQLMVSRLKQGGASAASATAAAAALHAAEEAEASRAARVAAHNAKKRGKCRARELRRRAAAACVASAVVDWWARRRAARRELARDAHHARERERIERKLTAAASRADAALVERIVAEALARKRRETLRGGHRAARLANPEVAMGHLAAQMVASVLD